MVSALTRLEDLAEKPLNPTDMLRLDSHQYLPLLDCAASACRPQINRPAGGLTEH